MPPFRRAHKPSHSHCGLQGTMNPPALSDVFHTSALGSERWFQAFLALTIVDTIPQEPTGLVKHSLFFTFHINKDEFQNTVLKIQYILKKRTHLLTEYFKPVVTVQDGLSTYVFTDFEISCFQNLHIGFSMSQETCICMCIYQNHKDFCMHQAVFHLQVLITLLAEFVNMPGWFSLKAENLKLMLKGN